MKIHHVLDLIFDRLELDQIDRDTEGTVRDLVRHDGDGLNDTVGEEVGDQARVIGLGVKVNDLVEWAGSVSAELATLIVNAVTLYVSGDEGAGLCLLIVLVVRHEDGDVGDLNGRCLEELAVEAVDG